MSENLRLSVSKTKTFLDCKKKYKFAYVEKLPKKDWDHHIFGKFIHTILENFHRHYLDGYNDPFHVTMTNVYKDALIEYKGKLKVDAKKEAYEMISSYLNELREDRVPIKNVVAVEKQFDFFINDVVVLNGMIDRVQLDPDGIVHVCDYKTVKNKKYLKNDFLQLLTYAYVLYSENNDLKKIRGSYILLRHNFEYITKEFDIDEILNVKDKYENYAKTIKEERLWEPSPSKLCAWCDFIDVCPEGKKTVQYKTSFGETEW